MATYDDWKTTEPEYFTGELIHCAGCDDPNHPDDLKVGADGSDYCASCQHESVQCLVCGAFAERVDVDDCGLCPRCEPEQVAA
jgi:hypothetical protein